MRTIRTKEIKDFEEMEMEPDEILDYWVDTINWGMRGISRKTVVKDITALVNRIHELEESLKKCEKRIRK